METPQGDTTIAIRPEHKETPQGDTTIAIRLEYKGRKSVDFLPITGYGRFLWKKER